VALTLIPATLFLRMMEPPSVEVGKRFFMLVSAFGVDVSKIRVLRLRRRFPLQRTDWRCLRSRKNVDLAELLRTTGCVKAVESIGEFCHFVLHARMPLRRNLTASVVVFWLRPEIATFAPSSEKRLRWRDRAAVAAVINGDLACKAFHKILQK